VLLTLLRLGAFAVRIGTYRLGEGWKNLGNIMVSQSNKGETIVEARGFDI